ncbi:hypothetical protein KVA01_08400 [Kocuria varians]|uniref:Uncharacterized protein n=1 Tax=Kocuria varians TaxID=1272 RepID=A0A4Y4D0H1_KOCVA|nr:hypothetical protein KVA01_08400 [Kocuria varians]
MNPVTTPSAISAGTSLRRNERIAGRAIIHKNTTPKHIRNHAVPAAPTWSITGTDRALESCTDSIAATAIDHGGIPVVVRALVTVLRSGDWSHGLRRPDP